MTSIESIVVLIPVLDDWQAMSLLIPRLAAALRPVAVRAGLLIVDDGSTESAAEGLAQARRDGFDWVRVLRLRRNLGHQRAIAVGLCYVDEHLECDAVVVMDGDGEDQPEDVGRLVARERAEPGAPIVFAERQRRVEGLTFRAFYMLYRMLHRPLTGRSVKVGNFSLVPRVRLQTLTVVSELWIHYAASVLRSRQPTCGVPVNRGRRLDGRSRMNFVSLVVHGLSAISVYSDVVFTRLVMATALLATFGVIGLVVLLSLKLGKTYDVPSWAPIAAAFLLLVLIQAGTFIASLVFVVLGTRQQSAIIPRRDYGYYISGVSELDAA